MRQADVAGEATWGASWIYTSILGDTEDTNGCFEFNLCYFLPAGITYKTFAIHSVMPFKCCFWVFSLNFPSILLVFNTHFSLNDTIFIKFLYQFFFKLLS